MLARTHVCNTNIPTADHAVGGMPSADPREVSASKTVNEQVNSDVTTSSLEGAKCHACTTETVSRHIMPVEVFTGGRKPATDVSS